MRRSSAVVVLVALAVALFSLTTVETLPVGLLPVIAADLGVSRSAVGLLVTGYGLVVAVLSVPLTHWVRRVPRRTLLLALLGVFVLATAVSAVAPNYGALLASRVTVALAHAVFWSVVATAAAGLFSPAVRGRVVAGLFTGPALAGVAGVPLGTWFGQHAGWRLPFLVVSGLGFTALVAVFALLPAGAAQGGHAGRGVEPDLRRFVVLMATTVVVVCGFFTTYTYVTAFLTDVAGFAEAATAPVLLASGVAGFVGTSVAGAVVDRWPRSALVAAVGSLGAALLGLHAFGATPAATVALVMLFGAAVGAMTTALQSRILVVAPGSTEIASAISSAMFNVGIAGGSLLGGLLLPTDGGVRSLVLVGGLLAVAALGILLTEPLWVARR
ncbi:MFS transporter [Saccharothrix sp. S26]|uniref:MFS transporter n=1 Tax=Saccharothrix sp. S26 TaxID=2907215 RepID=UPI001F356B78|nr:MFS transporter [Saccharothrix sp. S26]MCE6998018.1 MFS transporter [Saccharothrix sp. S26]